MNCWPSSTTWWWTRPAAYYGSDSAVIAARCGAALVVARQNKARVHSLENLVASLSESPAKLVGVIVNEF